MEGWNSCFGIREDVGGQPWRDHLDLFVSRKTEGHEIKQEAGRSVASMNSVARYRRRLNIR
jgi:hypothetical protein